MEEAVLRDRRPSGSEPSVLRIRIPRAVFKKARMSRRRKKKEMRPWVVSWSGRRRPESLQVCGLQGAKTAWAGVKLEGKADDTWKPQWVSLGDTRKEAPFYSRPIMQRSSEAKGCFSISTGRCGMHEGTEGPIGGSSSMANSGGHI